MLTEKIKKYVNDQWFYAANKMACDPNLTTEHNLRNWINVLNKTHNDAKDPFEKECLKAYICFFLIGSFMIKIYRKLTKLLIII